MNRLRMGQAAVLAAGVVGAGVSSSSADAANALFSSALTFTYDAQTLQRAADMELFVPTITGTVVYDVDEAEDVVFDGFNTATASPGAGLVSLEITGTLFGQSVTIDETDDFDFPEAPFVDLFDEQVVGIDYIFEDGDAFASIEGNEFFGSAEIFVIDGSGTVSFGEAIFIGTDPGDDDMGGGDGDGGDGPAAIPTPTAAAAGFALMGLLSARRRRLD